MQRLVMMNRADRPEHTPESEPVLIDTDTTGELRLVMHDGIELVVSTDELARAGVVVSKGLQEAA